MNFGVLGKNGAIAGGILGLVMGILGIIPLISCLNCILGFLPGVGAAFLFEKDAGTVSVGEGAVAGAIGGIITAVISSVITVPISFLISGGANIMSQMPADMPAGPVAIVLIMLGAIIIGGIILAIINAGTGAVYALIKNR